MKAEVGEMTLFFEKHTFHTPLQGKTKLRFKTHLTYRIGETLTLSSLGLYQAGHFLIVRFYLESKTFLTLSPTKTGTFKSRQFGV